jgi:hypothetical protein
VPFQANLVRLLNLFKWSCHAISIWDQFCQCSANWSI